MADPSRRRGRVGPAVTALVAVLVAVLAVWLVGQARREVLTEALLVVAAVLAVGAAVIATIALVDGRRTRLATVLLVVATVMAVAPGLWIGANSPTAGWFGSVVSHGPRTGRDVALTFDDGPNDSATAAISAILDQHGAKGTFFLVGKAVDARPDEVRALVADGQLVGNHSFHHDSTRWLDPRYPELDRAQRAIDQQAGVCPAFYRPPHGQHTPFMAAVVHHADMTLVTWDVSVGDWASTNADGIARRVLSRVRPGSIIDLHDGLDGRPGVDRSVLVQAMPAILDGLAARGLHPVRLDELLGRPGYQAAARC